MGNNNYYSGNSPIYNNNEDHKCNNNEDHKCNNNVCEHMNFENNYMNYMNHNDCEESNHRHERECCGRRFNNRSVDREVKRALEAFEKQLENTEDAIDCLNKVFNNLEDEIFEDRCCPSNRIKNILKSIQREICDLEDDLRDIEDDFECLEQAL